MMSCAVSIGRKREIVGIRAVSEEGSRQDFLRVQLNACPYLTVRVPIFLLLETTDVVLDSSVFADLQSFSIIGQLIISSASTCVSNMAVDPIGSGDVILASTLECPLGATLPRKTCTCTPALGKPYQPNERFGS